MFTGAELWGMGIGLAAGGALVAVLWGWANRRYNPYALFAHAPPWAPAHTFELFPDDARDALRTLIAALPVKPIDVQGNPLLFREPVQPFWVSYSYAVWVTKQEDRVRVQVAAANAFTVHGPGALAATHRMATQVFTQLALL